MMEHLILTKIEKHTKKQYKIGGTRLPPLYIYIYIYIHIYIYIYTYTYIYI